MTQSAYQPRIAVIVLGRERGGFDQRWTATVLRETTDYLKRAYTHLSFFEPAKSTLQLQQICESSPYREADIVLYLQPSIADGSHINLIAQYAQNKSIVFWATMEKLSGEMISSNSLVGTHLFVATLRQYNLRVGCIYGSAGDKAVQREIERELKVAHAVCVARRARIGIIGSHAPGFIDLHVDPRTLNETVGATVDHISITDFFHAIRTLPEHEQKTYLERIQQYRLPNKNIKELSAALTMQATFWAVYETLMHKKQLDGMAFRCWPDLPNTLGHWPYAATSYMLAELKAVAIEGDIDAALSTAIAYALGAEGVYLSDWLAHDESAITLWHGGAIPLQMCVDDNSAYAAHLALHFNNKLPTVIDATVKADMNVTVWRMWQFQGSYYCTALEGKTTIPTQHLLGTNCCVSVDTINVKRWFQQRLRDGMPHHVCVSTNLPKAILQQFAYLMDWEWKE